MRLRLTLTETAKVHDLPPAYLRRIIRVTLCAAEPYLERKAGVIALDLAAVTEQEMMVLNTRYRGKRRPTDILSFGNFERLADIKRFRGKVLDLGQIVLAPAVIAAAARADGVSWRREFTYVFSHGVLHLVGFDHSPRMFQIQDEVTDALAPR